MNNTKAKALFPWAGGKQKQIKRMRESYPKGIGEEITKYCEPFVGAGTVLFDILNNYDIKEVLINDYNPEIINLYNVVRDNPNPVMDILDLYEKELAAINDRQMFKRYYFEKRNEFNKIRGDDSCKTERAALFILVMKLCFNGVYDTCKKNKKNGHTRGDFITDVGYKKKYLYKKEEFLAVSEKLQNVKIMQGDYTNVSNFVDASTFVYLDPPYWSKECEGGGVDYSPENGEFSQVKLAHFIKELCEKGAKVATTNSDPKAEDPTNEYLDNLYYFMNKKRYPVHASVGRSNKARGEILFSNY